MLHTYLSSDLSQKLRKLSATLALPILAILPLQMRAIPIQYNSIILICIFIGAICHIRWLIHRKRIWTYADIGCARENLTNGLVYYIPLILVGITCFIVAWYIMPPRHDITIWKLFISALVCAFMQQGLLNGYFAKKVREIFNNHRQISCIVVIISFVYIHSFFSNWVEAMLLSALFGTVSVILYSFRPNLVFASLAHTPFNAFVIYIYVFSPIWS